jgi:predicted metal-dependent hydrolase
MNDLFFRGVELFNRGLYFKAHEIWEQAWNDSEGVEKRCLQALIQIAVAFLKWQSGIPGGALKMHRMACDKLSQLPDSCLGLDVREIEKNFKNALAPLLQNQNAPFPSNVFRL